MASSPYSFVLSPRNALKSAALLRELGSEQIKVAESNAAVLEAADVIFVAVLPSQAEEVLEALSFCGERHRVVSLMAGVDLAKLKKWTKTEKVCIAIPLPIVAKRRGVTLMVPRDPLAEAIFRDLGGAVCVEDEEQFTRMQAMTCIMGDLYERQRTAYEWLAKLGVPREAAAAYVGALFHCMTDDSADADPTTFQRLVDEQTPGGMNQMVIQEQQDDHNYQALEYSLDSLHTRITTGQEATSSNKPRARRGAPPGNG